MTRGPQKTPVCIDMIICSGTSAEVPRVVTALRPTDRFRRAGHLVLFGGPAYVLDVRDPGPPREITPGLGPATSPIVVCSDGSFLCASVRTVYRATVSGELAQVLSLESIRIEGDYAGLDVSQGMIRGLLSVGRSARTVYFGLMLSATNWRDRFVCRCDTQTGKAILVPVAGPASCAVDCRHGLVYALEIGNRRGRNGVRVRAFGAARNDFLPTSRRHEDLDISPTGETLLLSSKTNHVATLDLASGVETALPCEGSAAVWCGREFIVFHHGYNTLWRYRLGTKLAERLFLVEGHGDRLPWGIEYPARPVSSPDGSWVACNWLVRTARRSRILMRRGSRRRVLRGFHGAILCDLINREYRILEGQIVSAAWVQGRKQKRH